MDNLSKANKLILSFQHVLAMFGATVLVPILTGLDPTISILSAGIGTLLFHSVTKGIVPVFLGSSFAFIGAVSLILSNYGVAYVKGGIIATGFVYILIAIVIKIFGAEKIKQLLPPIVTGPIVTVIGLRLAPTALGMIGYTLDVETGLGYFDLKSLIIASSVVVTMVAVSIFAKGFFKLVPILFAVFVGYSVAILFGVVDFTPIQEAPWIGFSEETRETLFTLPKFSLESVMAIAPIAFVVFIEHIGDITTNGAVVNKDFFENPGVHRTMIGDGIATIAAGFLGAPPNTTYSENTGVLAVTKVYDTSIIRMAAVVAICVSLIGKVGGFINSLPSAVMGGVSVILFGMIASVGVRTMIDAKLDFSHSRNLMIMALILVIGITVDNVYIAGNVTISGLAIAGLVGVILNKVLPEEM